MSDRYRPSGPRGSQRSEQSGAPSGNRLPSSTYSSRDSYVPSRDRSSRDSYRGTSRNNGYQSRESYESYKRHQHPSSAEESAPPKKRAPPSGPSGQKQPPSGPRGGRPPPVKKQLQKPKQPNTPKSDPRKRLVRKLMPHQIYSVKFSACNAYKRIQQVGEGTYGKVYKAINEVTTEHVALKRLRLESEREGFPITAIREIKLLQSFDHENIVSLYEIMVEHNQVYMIFDYCDHDLLGLLSMPMVKLSEGHRKYLFRQLLSGLSYLHSKQVIHRDIKGSNILVDEKGRLKIADFGLARTMKVVQDGESPDYTNRVITIWYRPPELLLGATNYGREVDVWGVGCLLLELYAKLAAFRGADEVSQLYKIYSVMGTPTLEEWPEITKLPWFEMLTPKVVIKSQFGETYRSIMSELGFDLATMLLQMNPARRITADEALSHPWFTSDPQPEPLTFLSEIEGEWHEFESKKFRRRRAEEEARQKHDAREEKSALSSLAPATSKEPSVTPAQISPGHVEVPKSIPTSAVKTEQPTVLAETGELVQGATSSASVATVGEVVFEDTAGDITTEVNPVKLEVGSAAESTNITSSIAIEPKNESAMESVSVNTK